MVFIFFLFLNQAFERYAGSAHAAALAHAFTAQADGVDAIRFNPAALSALNQNQVLTGYEYVLSGIEGLHNITIGFARPFAFGAFGIQLSEFGFSEQKEQALTLAYGLSLSKDLKLGIGGDLYFINNRRTGHGLSYGLNVGFIGTIYKKWTLGVFGHNLNQPQFGSGEEGGLPADLRAGLAYEPFEGITSEIDFSMVGDNLRIHMAGEFRLFDIIFLRAGTKTNPSVVSGGLGVVYKFMKIDYAAEHIPELPLTHSLTLKFKF